MSLGFFVCMCICQSSALGPREREETEVAVLTSMAENASRVQEALNVVSRPEQTKASSVKLVTCTQMQQCICVCVDVCWADDGLSPLAGVR